MNSHAVKLALVIASALTIGSTTGCGSDEQDNLPGSADGGSAGAGGGGQDYEAGFDDDSVAVAATTHAAYETAMVIDNSPFTVDAAARTPEYQCSQNGHGSCPTVTVNCETLTITSVKLEYKSTDDCKTESGDPLSGQLVYTRNAVRDWTVDLETLARGNLSLDGQMGFTKSQDQPWAVTVTELKISGSSTDTILNEECTEECVSSVEYSANYDLTVSTGSPLSVDADLTNKTLTLNGQLVTTGTTTGHVKVTAKGRLGKDAVPIDRDINRTFDSEGIQVNSVVFSLPPSCTCPQSGSVVFPSETGCGDATVAFSAGAGKCPDASVSYTDTSSLCSATAQAATLVVAEMCAN